MYRVFDLHLLCEPRWTPLLRLWQTEKNPHWTFLIVFVVHQVFFHLMKQQMQRFLSAEG